jgi:hypothetical protein
MITGFIILRRVVNSGMIRKKDTKCNRCLDAQDSVPRMHRSGYAVGARHVVPLRFNYCFEYPVSETTAVRCHIKYSGFTGRFDQDGGNTGFGGERILTDQFSRS